MTEQEKKTMIQFTRVPMSFCSETTRTQTFDPVELGYNEAEAIAEAKRCLQCKHKPCMQGCPLHIDIPGFIGPMKTGDFEAAFEQISKTQPFPAICGRVCPQEQQCEKNCVLAKKGDPIAVGHLERFIGDWAFEHLFESSNVVSQPKNGKRVAIIGSGPAGLTVASELIRAGFEVTVFEALHAVGGVLMYGIPAFRLPKDLVKKIVQRLEQQGVKIERNVVVGKTITVDELMQEERFAAVFVGSGAGLPQMLNIPGEHSTGVYTANEYLTRVNLMEAYRQDSKTPIIRGKTVITIGGGNVSMDTSRTALRLGAERSIVVYRRGEAEMPAREAEIKHAKEEGVLFYCLSNPVAVVADETGLVKALKCVKMEFSESDASGRRSVKPVEDSEFEIQTDVVVISIGNRPNPIVQRSTPDLEVSERGTLMVDEGCRTSKKGVYAGGDIVLGASTVVLAIETGKIASQSIMADFAIIT